MKSLDNVIGVRINSTMCEKSKLMAKKKETNLSAVVRNALVEECNRFEALENLGFYQDKILAVRKDNLVEKMSDFDDGKEIRSIPFGKFFFVVPWFNLSETYSCSPYPHGTCCLEVHKTPQSSFLIGGLVEKSKNKIVLSVQPRSSEVIKVAFGSIMSIGNRHCMGGDVLDIVTKGCQV